MFSNDKFNRKQIWSCCENILFSYILSKTQHITVAHTIHIWNRRWSTHKVLKDRYRKWKKQTIQLAKAKGKKKREKKKNLKNEKEEATIWWDPCTTTRRVKTCKQLIDNEWFWQSHEIYLVLFWWNISIKPPLMWNQQYTHFCEFFFFLFCFSSCFSFYHCINKELYDFAFG